MIEKNFGHFYVMLVCPDLSGSRIKLGFATNVMKRHRSFTTISPTVKIVKSWPCLQEHETAIISLVTESGCKRIGREVFDFDSVDVLVKTLDDIFASGKMPEFTGFVTVTVPKLLMNNLRTIAEKKNCPLVSLVRKACEEYLKSHPE